MNEVKIIEKKFIQEYVQEMFYMNSCNGDELINADYHHNPRYETAPSILKNNILSIKRMQELGLIKLSEKQILLYGDISSHINGMDGISLSKVGLKDLYRDEIEYNPFQSNYLDYRISNNIKTRRCTQHYGNEFVTYSDILLSDIKSIDFRLVKYMQHKRECNMTEEDFQNSIIKKYNTILYLAQEIQKRNLDILIREMSTHIYNIDIYKVSQLPKLVKKK